MKKRRPDQVPWMDAADYGRSLKPGIGFNLLVREIKRSVDFCTMNDPHERAWSDGHICR